MYVRGVKASVEGAVDGLNEWLVTSSVVLSVSTLTVPVFVVSVSIILVLVRFHSQAYSLLPLQL